VFFDYIWEYKKCYCKLFHFRSLESLQQVENVYFCFKNLWLLFITRTFSLQLLLSTKCYQQLCYNFTFFFFFEMRVNVVNLTFMGPCIIIIFYYINPNKMHMLQSLFYLTTALHVSGVTITHLQEHKTTVTTASGNGYTVLLSPAIVEELELIWVCCGWPPTTHSNQFQLFHDSSGQQYGVTVTRCCSYSCFVLLKVGDSDARNM